MGASRSRSNAALSSLTCRSTGLASRILGGSSVDGGVEPAHPLLQANRPVDQLAQPLRQQADHVGVAVVAGRQLDLGLFLAGLDERHLALVHRTMQQQPGGELHQPGGQPHALGRIGERRVALELLRFAPSGTVEIAGGLLDQRHAFAEQERKSLRAGQPFAKRHSPVAGPTCPTWYASRAPLTATQCRSERSRMAGTCPGRLSSAGRGRSHGAGRNRLAQKVRAGAPGARRDGTKKSRRCRRLKVITGRRQTEWTGATQCPEVGRHE